MVVCQANVVMTASLYTIRTKAFITMWIVETHAGLIIPESFFLPVWRDRVRRLATEAVVMRSSPAAGHIRCALLANQPK